MMKLIILFVLGLNSLQVSAAALACYDKETQAYCGIMPCSDGCEIGLPIIKQLPVKIEPQELISTRYFCTDGVKEYTIQLDEKENSNRGLASVANGTVKTNVFFQYFYSGTLSKDGNTYNLNLNGLPMKALENETSMKIKLNISSVTKVGIGTFTIFNGYGEKIKGPVDIDCFL